MIHAKFKFMIPNSLQFTKDVLQQYLKNKIGLDESKVVINKLVDNNGNVPQKNQNKVILSLINIQRETTKPFNIRNQKMDDGNFSRLAPIERYNLDLLVTSNFDDYDETLKFLNEAILFFQINPSIDSSTNSNIPKGIKKLEFELEKNTYHQIHSLWNAMGAKYQPSIIYKMRLITLNSQQIDGFDSSIQEISNQAIP